MTEKDTPVPCLPPEGTADHTYHWLRQEADGRSDPFLWWGGKWLDFCGQSFGGSEMEFWGWHYHCPAKPNDSHDELVAALRTISDMAGKVTTGTSWGTAILIARAALAKAGAL